MGDFSHSKSMAILAHVQNLMFRFFARFPKTAVVVDTREEIKCIFLNSNPHTSHYNENDCFSSPSKQASNRKWLSVVCAGNFIRFHKITFLESGCQGYSLEHLTTHYGNISATVYDDTVHREPLHHHLCTVPLSLTRTRRIASWIQIVCRILGTWCLRGFSCWSLNLLHARLIMRLSWTLALLLSTVFGEVSILVALVASSLEHSRLLGWLLITSLLRSRGFPTGFVRATSLP